MCGGRFLKKRWIWRVENLWRFSQKNLTMGTSNEESRNPHSVSSKKGLHSIEESIGNEAKLANVMWMLVALETKDPILVNQVSPTPSAGCTYCQAMNMCLKSVACSWLIKCCPNIWMQHSQSPPTIHIHTRTIPIGEIIQISHGPKTPTIILGPISSTISNHLIINTIFSVKLHNLPSKVPLLTRSLPIWRKFWHLSCRIQDKSYLD